jgi:hypothetical protein
MKRLLTILLFALLLGCTKEQKEVIDETTKDIIGANKIKEIDKAKEAVKMAEEVSEQMIEDLNMIQ